MRRTLTLTLAVALAAPLTAHAGSWYSFSSYGDTASKQSTASWWTIDDSSDDDGTDYVDLTSCTTCGDLYVELDQGGYEALLDDLNTGAIVSDLMGDDGLNLDVIPQLWEGTSMNGLLDGTHVGNVHTDKDGSHWTETWVLFDGDAFGREASLSWEGPGLLVDYQPAYDADPESDGWVVLEFDYEYRTPPTAAAIASLPDTVPTFVTETTVYEVHTTSLVTGETELTGGLHRQHYQATDGTEWWRDTWVLWQDYVRPVGPEVATELVVESTALSTVKAFLEDQAGHPQFAYVQTTATPEAL